MAIFNPQVQPGRDDIPNWQKTSQPISDLKADTSSGIALQTVGNAIEGGATLADQTAKDVINKDVRDTVEPIRKDFTQSLEQIRNGSDPNNLLPTNSTPTQGGTQPVPDAINSGLSKVDNLQSALINGKINDTYYHGRLAAAVTDLRSKYPGYTDYIDQRVSQATGVNPANAYVGDLMQDINRMQTTKKTAIDKAKDDAMKSGYPNSDQMIKTLNERGESYLPTFQEWYANQTQFDADLKRREALRKDSNATKDELNNQRTSDWTVETGNAVHSNLDAMVKISGLDKPIKISEMIAQAAANPDKYNEAQYKQLGTQLLAQQQILETQLTARVNQTARDSQGRTYSYASDIGAEKARAILNSQTAVYKTMGEALQNGQVGLAFYAANHAKAILDQSKDNLLTDDSTGPWAAKIATFQDLMGPNWTNLVTSNSLRNNIDDKMRGYFDNNVLDARLGRESVTMKSHLEDVDKLQKQGKIDAGMKSRYIGNLVNIVDDIKNPQAPDQDKINVVKYLFSPEGQGILSHIKTDYTDPVSGKFVPGKYSVFNRLTSDDVAGSIAKLSKSDHQIGQMYKNYIEREAGSQLFYKELQNLNQFTGHDDLHFKFNDGAGGGVPHIELIQPNNQPIARPGQAPLPPQSQGYLFQVQKIVDRLNDGLSGLSRVERSQGGDAANYILNFMQRSQVDLGKNWEGLPKNLADAIAASRTPKRRIEDTFESIGRPR